MMGLLLDEAARRAGRPTPVAVPDAEACSTPPLWYVAAGTYDPRPGTSVEAGPPACPAHDGVRRAFGPSPLSGTLWTLYRRG